MSDYTDFKILLDDPAVRPGLRFDGYAAALGQIIEKSRAQFSIGIFGSWGSGKTTLMRAVERRFQARHDIVPVWFNAWRYEKEPHMLIPLIDTLRAALLAQAGELGEVAEVPGSARKMAATLGRVGRALLAGLTLTAGPPVLQAALEPGKVLDYLSSEPDAPNDGLSFYAAGFRMLHQAAAEFFQNGAHRLVVLVDDLDRCLPENALEVLESMKLFFDLEGFVFVVGLDQDIVEHAIDVKYGRSAVEEPQFAGGEYIKKLFQLPFTLPRVDIDQLQEYLDVLAVNADFSAAQLLDFETNIRRHLRYLSAGDSINPREIKRLINMYVLQLKMLSMRLAGVEPDIVLALQAMSFHSAWLEAYEHLVADPDLFQRAAAEAFMESKSSIWMSGTRIVLPPDLIRYLKEDASALLTTSSLRSYVSAAESTRSIDPSVLEMQSTVGRIRGLIDQALEEDQNLRDLAPNLVSDTRLLLDKAKKRSAAPNSELEVLIAQLDGVLRELNYGDRPLTGSGGVEWAARISEILNSIDRTLRELRRHANVGASTS